MKKKYSCSVRSTFLLLMTVGGMVFRTIGVETVAESARQLPLLQTVDVAVIGGTFGAVSAAVAAKNAGASVILIAPRPALGEECVTTRRLVTDPDAEGAMEGAVHEAFPPRVNGSYTYRPDVAPDASHNDPACSVLKNGDWTYSATQSVQFNSDVTLSVTVAQDQGSVNKLVVYAFRRDEEAGFRTQDVSVSFSTDGINYTPLPGTLTVSYNVPVLDHTDPIDQLLFTPDTPCAARFYKVTCVKRYARQLLAELFVETDAAHPAPVRPLIVEKVLDAQLLDAKIPFLTGSPVTDVLVDSSDKIAGVVIANRNGRQAIIAKTVIDASEWNGLARLCPGGNVLRTRTDPVETLFSRVVNCREGDLQNLPAAYTVTPIYGNGVTSNILPADLRPADAPVSCSVNSYTITRTFPLFATDTAELAAIEQTFRDDTWTASTFDASEKLFFTPPERIYGGSSLSDEAWPGAETVSLDVFIPVNNPELTVLGPAADVPRKLAEQIQRPGTAWILGRRLGIAAAERALAAPEPGDVHAGTVTTETGTAEVHERLTRPDSIYNMVLNSSDTVPSRGALLSVVTNVDIVVVGAGTAGAPAAIAAGRAGKRVLVLDYLYGMGGVATESRIGSYFNGNRRGFTSEIDAGTGKTGWVWYAAKAEWLRSACRAAGVGIWFGSFAEGVVTDGEDDQGRSRVTGIVAVLPDGTRGVIQAQVVIDSTGNADITAAAGGKTTFIDGRELALQGASAASHVLGDSSRNTDVGFLDDTDAGSLTFFALRGRMGMTDTKIFNAAFVGTGSRERRRIVGDTVVTEIDVLRGRTYPDTIMHGLSSFDLHGFTSSDLFMYRNTTQNQLFTADLPYRALLPATLDGVLATGLGISATRDAMPVMRMQPDVQNQGYAAGLAAAAAVTQKTSLRNIDVKALQQALIAANILDERVLTDTDLPVTDDALRNAVNNLDISYGGLEVILAAPERAAPFLREAYAAAPYGDRRVCLACVLTLIGDQSGVTTLLNRAAYPWDTGYDFKGMDQFGRATSFMDGVAFALGRTGDPQAVPALGTMISTLGTSSELKLSHLRMVTLAAETISKSLQTPLLAPVLANVLTNTALIKHWSSTKPVGFHKTSSTNDLERTRVLCELSIGRALYRLSDTNAFGNEIMTRYAADPRGAYSAHARLVLEDGVLPQERQDGIWIGTAAEGVWTDPSVWVDGLLPDGTLAHASFTPDDDVSRVVSLDDRTVTLGALDFAGVGSWTFRNGLFILNGFPTDLSVDKGSVSFETPITGLSIQKNGEGSLLLANETVLRGYLDVTDGSLQFGSDNIVYQPFTAPADTAPVFDDKPVGYGYTFTLSGGPVLVTHLGCYEATGTGFTRDIRAYLDSKKDIIASVLFSPYDSGFLRNGYRFQRLAEPLMLTNGVYTLRAFGYAGSQSCLIAADGAEIAAPDTADGRISFGTSLLTGTSAGCFTETVPGKTGYAASAVSLLFEPCGPTQTVSGVLNVSGTVKLATPSVTVGGLTGTGTITVAETDAPATLAVNVAFGVQTTFDGTLSDANAGGKLGLIKKGLGTLTLAGTNVIKDAVYCQEGTLAVKTAETLSPDVPLYFGEISQNLCGMFTVLQPDAVISNPIHALRFANYNTVWSGLSAAKGERLTLRDTRIAASDEIRYSGVNGSFSLLAPAGTTNKATRLTLTNVAIDYIDLVARPEGDPASSLHGDVVLDNLPTMTHLRKLVSVNTVSNSIGGTTLLSGTNTILADWVDLTGYGTTLRLTDAVTLVAGMLRCPTGIAGLSEANGTIVLEDKARLVASRLPESVFNTTNTLCVFDGGTLQNKQNDQPDFMPFPVQCPPAQILSRGLTLDLWSYDLAKKTSVRIQHPMTSPVPDAPGPLTIRNGTCKLAADMSFNGPVRLEGAELWFDFLQSKSAGLTEILKSGAELLLDDGAVRLISTESGKTQNFASIRNVSADKDAIVTVSNGCTVTAGQLEAGTLLIKDGDGELGLTLSTGSEEPLLTGSVRVDAGTLRIETAEITTPFLPVTEGSFEPDPPLAANGAQSQMDKRGSRDASYFASNLTSWTFDKSDSVGITRNGGYFVNNVTNGQHCAFIRGTGAGISKTLTFAHPTVCKMSFEFKSRFYNNTMYKAGFEVSLDGSKIQTTKEISSNVWTPVTVDFGLLSAGSHTIRIAGVGGNSDALLDDVRLSTKVPESNEVVSSLIDPELEITVSGGGKVAFDFNGCVDIKAFLVNGKKYYGVISEQTLPSIVSGTGSCRISGGNSLLILK